MAKVSTDRVFPAMLKYWRGRRGLSQLDLGLTADVSARHISFLETGRSRPSVEMVALLAEVLDVPLRDRNELFRAGGFDPRYPERALGELLDGPLQQVIDAMLTQHDPFPMIVADRLYNIVLANQAAGMLVGAFFPNGDVDDLNLLRVLFVSEVGRKLVVNWDEVASNTLRRLQRETLHSPQDEELRDLHDELIGQDSTPHAWRTPDLGDTSEPFLPIRLRLADEEPVLSFLTTITMFSAPQNVALDELRIEAWYPADDATAEYCGSLGVGTE